MSSSQHHLSDYDPAGVPPARGMRFALAVSEWNGGVTEALLKGALDTLALHGAREQDIRVERVPGSFELVYASARLARDGGADAVIALGCVIRGDTPHFDYICQGVTQGLAGLNAEGQTPVIYGLLTCNDTQQARDRSGGTLGNKGCECAVTAIKMADLRRRLS